MLARARQHPQLLNFDSIHYTKSNFQKEHRKNITYHGDSPFLRRLILIDWTRPVVVVVAKEENQLYR